MNIGVELSIKFSKHTRHNNLIASIENAANVLGCSHFFCDYELGGKITTNYTKRNHFVITVLFENAEPIDAGQFVNDIDLTHKINLECVYENDIPYKFIYCSSYYRKSCLNRDIINYDEIKQSTTRANLELWLQSCST